MCLKKMIISKFVSNFMTVGGGMQAPMPPLDPPLVIYIFFQCFKYKNIKQIYKNKNKVHFS